VCTTFGSTNVLIIFHFIRSHPAPGECEHGCLATSGDLQGALKTDVHLEPTLSVGLSLLDFILLCKHQWILYGVGGRVVAEGLTPGECALIHNYLALGLKRPQNVSVS
jgi:hypothetical protein